MKAIRVVDTGNVCQDLFPRVAADHCMDSEITTDESKLEAGKCKEVIVRLGKPMVVLDIVAPFIGCY